MQQAGIIQRWEVLLCSLSIFVILIFEAKESPARNAVAKSADQTNHGQQATGNGTNEDPTDLREENE